MQKNTSKYHLSNKTIILIIVVFLLVGGGIAFAISRSKKSDSTTPHSGNTSGVNLNPPTAQELKQTDEHKKNLGNQNTPTTTTPSGKKQVNPVITNADEQEVNVNISGIFEEGGTCVATFSKDGKTVTKQSKGFGNVSYTSCEPIEIKGALSTGEWSVTVSYSSSAAEGVSSARTFMVR